MMALFDCRATEYSETSRKAKQNKKFESLQLKLNSVFPTTCTIILDILF